MYVADSMTSVHSLAIQNATASSLWVAIPEGFLGNYPNPVQLPELFSEAVQELRAAGMPEQADIFLAGHSLGGIVVQGKSLAGHRSARRPAVPAAICSLSALFRSQSLMLEPIGT